MCNRRTSSSILISVLLTIVKAQLHTAEECPAGAAQCDAVPELLSWAAAHGAQCDRLQTDNTLAIRGLTAITDIPGGSVIVSLPRSLALSVSPSQSCPIPHLIPEDVWSSSIKNFQLALLFLAETKKDRDSAWYPYIQTLPQHVDSLVHWSDTELHELQYGATELEQQFLQEAKQQLEDIRELYWKLESSGLVTELNSTLEDLVWASDIVRSRAFAISAPEGWLSPKSIGVAAFMANVIISIARSVTFMCIGAILFGTQHIGNMDLALLPVIDSINHNSSSLGHLQPGGGGSTVEAIIGPDGAQAFQEVTAAYATASNEVLLQHYGFVDMDNAHDEYTADILSFIEENVVEQPNEEQLQDVHASPALKTALSQAKLTSEGWSKETVTALRYLLASEEESRAAKSLQPVRWVTEVVLHRQLPTFGYVFKEAQSDATETRVDQVLSSLCQDISKSKTTSLDDDETALAQLQQTDSATYRRKLALQFRIGYKSLLNKCILQHIISS
ncbi:MAG: hypothetical protein FRX49_01105 [Trebouxia sp. A1-2]|nr:MAG: hypothetical protein FRX49_01105 [Trebouxia sp. A1-2]